MKINMYLSSRWQMITFCALLLGNIILSCNNGKDIAPNQEGTTVKVISKNLALANKTSELMSYEADNRFTLYTYGNFDASGVPNEITQSTITDSDSKISMNAFYDDSLRVKTAFYSKDSVRDTLLFSFQYPTPQTAILSVYGTNWTTPDLHPLHIIRLRQSGNTWIVDSTDTYNDGGGSGNNYEKFARTSTKEYMAKYSFVKASLIATNAIIVVGMAAIGGLSFGAPGAIIGGALGVAYVLNNTAYASETIQEGPTSAPKSPSSQIEGSPLHRYKIYMGFNTVNNTHSFFGENVCHHTRTIKDLVLQIVVDKQSSTMQIISAFGQANHFVTNLDIPECSQPGPHNNYIARYNLNSSNVSGQIIRINFTSIDKAPGQFISSFQGALSDNGGTGVMTIRRNWDVLTYTANLPVRLTTIN